MIMGKFNGRMLAQMCGYEQLYDAAVKNEQEGKQMAEQLRKDFNNRYNRIDECYKGKERRKILK